MSKERTLRSWWGLAALGWALAALAIIRFDPGGRMPAGFPWSPSQALYVLWAANGAILIACPQDCRRSDVRSIVRFGFTLVANFAWTGVLGALVPILGDVYWTLGVAAPALIVAFLVAPRVESGQPSAPAAAHVPQ